MFQSETPLGCAVVTPAPLAERFLIAWTLIFPPLHSGPVGDRGTHPSSANNRRKDVCHLFLSAHIPPAAHDLLFCPGKCLQFASGSGHLDEESAFSLFVFRHMRGYWSRAPAFPISWPAASELLTPKCHLQGVLIVNLLLCDYLDNILESVPDKSPHWMTYELFSLKNLFIAVTSTTSEVLSIFSSIPP